MGLPPLSLYIHIPWCEKKCPYCDFNSHTLPLLVDQNKRERDYINSLAQDLTDTLKQFPSLADRVVDTIFFGGGTPSLFSASAIADILDIMNSNMNLSDATEVSLEANPSSSVQTKFSELRVAGVNRLSIGVQSFNAIHLKKLGRVHSNEQARDAARAAIGAGFDNFNLDIMFGLPEQTLDQAIEDIEQALSFSQSHLSCYQLTLEPDTDFYANPPVTPDDEILWDMQEAIQRTLAAADFHQYEVSAYAQPGKMCQHNLNYWLYGDYIGLGAGAHGKISETDEAGTIHVFRTRKVAHPQHYMRRENKTAACESVNRKNRPFEFMLNALRLRDGFSLSTFEDRTNCHRDSITPLLERHQNLGAIKLDEFADGELWLKPTQLGFNMLNEILEDYLETE